MNVLCIVTRLTRLILEILRMVLFNKLCNSGACVALLFFISFLSPTTQALDDGSWAYTLDGNAATITGRVNSCPADLNIPDEVDGYTVTKIGAFAFSNAGVMTVKIPSTVLSIGGDAFQGNLIASVDLPNGLVDIGRGAFHGNVLTNIIIPNTVVSIGKEAFSFNKLTSVVIPNGLTELPDSIFAQNALTSVVIPDSVITIKRGAFYANAFTSIIIPKNVTSIGQLAFTYNEAAYYHFEGSRPEIHEEAFGTGLKLKRITYCDTTGWPGDETWLFRARGRDKTLIYPTKDCDGYLPIPEHTFTADIAFVLKGYGGGTAIPNINSFNAEAQRVVAALGALSLETHSYEIFDGGIESRGTDDYVLSAEPGPSGLADAMMKDVRLPANHEKYKKIIYLWSTDVQYDYTAGAWAGRCRGFGLVDSEGQELENIHISQDYGDQCAMVDLQTYTSSHTKTMVHELTHLYGHGGHDSDSIESFFEYSLMHRGAYGPIDTYPIWNRIYITKWLTEENITEDRNRLTDYSESSDKAEKYLLRLSKKNDFNCEDENRNPTRCNRYQELHKGTLIQNRGTFIREGKSYFQGGVVLEPVMDVDDITTPSIEAITVTNNVSTSEGIKDQITLVFSENITLGKGKIVVYESDYSDEQGFSISVNRLPQNSDGWDSRGGTALAEISGKNLIITSVMNGEKNYSIKFGQGSIIDWGGNSVSGKYCAFASDTDDTTDSDDDGIFDCADAFPLDASEIADNDSDGIGDNADTDADGDGISDSEDVFPLDASETLDADGDGIGNNRDPNDDNDSHDDWRDIFPLDPSETTDTDSDGIGNNADSDDDDDGVSDNLDAFPLDSSEWSDTDGDGIGDNTEIDDDCDCVVDTEDSFPLDSTESLDSDADGVGNNADTDDDNDGVLDINDALPLDPTESLDTDLDGIGNNSDSDDDNDSVLDADDAFPLDSQASVDSDGDGLADNISPWLETTNLPISVDYGFVEGAIVLFQLTNDQRAVISIDNRGYECKLVLDGVTISCLNVPNITTIGDHSVQLLAYDEWNGSSGTISIQDSGSSTESVAGTLLDDDDDGDGVADTNDDLPLDPTNDSDDDGVANNADAYPENSLYSKDSDNDGMPDAWEIKYGLDPSDSSDAISDQDNDGVSALDEFLAGTIPSGSLDIDGNGQYDALTDGLLLLRGMFGLDGSALITGTIASDAAFTESVDIESRIATLGDLADIDGNGQIDALTDGLLTLRYLFGLEGDTLIAGVVASDATRTTAVEIEAHLKTLMPAL